MKLSVIFGVAQMMLGVCLSVFNAHYFKKPYDFYYEFLPQSLFMMSLFGYVPSLSTQLAHESCFPPFL